MLIHALNGTHGVNASVAVRFTRGMARNAESPQRHPDAAEVDGASAERTTKSRGSNDGILTKVEYDR